MGGAYLSWLKHCDQCVATTDDRCAIGWVKVELVTPCAEGEDKWDHENPEFDFCSFTCLTEWAQATGRQVTAAVMGKLARIE